MKSALFLALAYFSGIEGFGLFAAYVALLMSIHLLVRKMRRGRVVRVFDDDLAPVVL